MLAAHTSLRLVQPDLSTEALPEGVAGRIGFDVEPAAESRMPLRLAGADRRVHPRQSLSLRVRGRRHGGQADVDREPFLNLSVEDVSVGGLRATSQTRLRVGERVTVFFPPTTAADGGRGWDAYGRVVRVKADAHQPGCEIAVAFDGLLAA